MLSSPAFALAAAGFIGWALGSVPTAYLLTRWFHGIDITRTGSANVGANNAFRTTGSRAIGIAVLVLDASKGAAAVGLGWMIAGLLLPSPDTGLPGMCAAAGLAAAMAGHNYNLPLTLATGGLAGGKGLATAAGGFLVLTPFLLASWLALWAVGFFAFSRWRGVRDVIPGNVFATVLIPLVAWVWHGGYGLFVVTILAALVLPKHVHQMRALLTMPDAVRDAFRSEAAGPTGRLQETVKPADGGRERPYPRSSEAR